MREMRRKMHIMYSRFFISFKPPFFLRLEVDIQQLIFPIGIILFNIPKKQANSLNFKNKFLVFYNN